MKACERVCDFHSVDGTGQEMLKEDREITYQQFIHLVYGYSFREIKPPSGYVLPETSEEGKAGRQVFFDSLQAGGNIQERKETEPKVSKHDVALVRAVREGTAVVIPANATELKILTWSSSNSSVAAVDSNGKVTGKKVGKSLIRFWKQNRDLRM